MLVQLVEQRLCRPWLLLSQVAQVISPYRLYDQIRHLIPEIQQQNNKVKEQTYLWVKEEATQISD